MLAGKTAVVTGAGRNIGAAIATRFAEEGASVIVNDLEEDRAQGVVEGLATDRGQVHEAFDGDMTDPEAVRALASTAADADGGLDILVNNLGYAVNKSVFDVSLEEWNQVLDICLLSTFLCTKHVGRVIADTGGGSIINMASRLGHAGKPGKAAYCAAKAGVVNLTRQTALDLVDEGIRVNSISPGMAGADSVGSESGRIEDRNDSVIPMRRIGDPEDVGDAAVFLASDLADYVTGADLAVDGGLGAG